MVEGMAAGDGDAAPFLPEQLNRTTAAVIVSAMMMRITHRPARRGLVIVRPPVHPTM
jgi:hypothetical protein